MVRWKLVNTYQGTILIYVGLLLPFSIYLMTNFFQTIPPFVYLVPVIMLFSIGRVPGIIASVLYALPPAIRLTSLGIRQVDPEIVEAARAFGSTSRQVLLKVELPLAMPSIFVTGPSSRSASK